MMSKSGSSCTAFNGTRNVSDVCNMYQHVQGYKYCKSIPYEGNCFFAAENEYLFQNSAKCLRCAVHTFGTAFRRCVFTFDGLNEPTGDLQRKGLPNDTAFVVWHVRLGHLVTHTHKDLFYARVLRVLRHITEASFLLCLSLNQLAKKIMASTVSLKIMSNL